MTIDSKIQKDYLDQGIDQEIDQEAKEKVIQWNNQEKSIKINKIVNMIKFCIKIKNHFKALMDKNKNLLDHRRNQKMIIWY